MAVDATREGALEQNFSDGRLMLGKSNFAFVYVCSTACALANFRFQIQLTLSLIEV